MTGAPVDRERTPGPWRIASGNDVDDYPRVSVDGRDSVRMYRVYSTYNGSTVAYVPTLADAQRICALASEPSGEPARESGQLNAPTVTRPWVELQSGQIWHRCPNCKASWPCIHVHAHAAPTPEPAACGPCYDGNVPVVSQNGYLWHEYGDGHVPCSTPPAPQPESLREQETHDFSTCGEVHHGLKPGVCHYFGCGQPAAAHAAPTPEPAAPQGEPYDGADLLDRCKATKDGSRCLIGEGHRGNHVNRNEWFEPASTTAEPLITDHPFKKHMLWTRCPIPGRCHFRVLSNKRCGQLEAVHVPTPKEGR